VQAITRITKTKTMKTYKTNLRKITLKEEKTEYKKSKITSSKHAYEVMKPFFENDMTICESFYILFLNNANNTTGFVKISQGGINATVADIRIIAKYCVETLSPAVIIAHNHPSGKLQPSASDRETTDKIKNALALFDCRVLDHLILTEEGYYSFADEGIL